MSTGVLTDWVIRPAEDVDAEAVAAVWWAARQASIGPMPPPERGEADVRRWVSEELMVEREVWVVEVAGRVAAMMALDRRWIDELYVHPAHTGQGLGGALVDLAKALRPGGFGLWVYADNAGAQRFYARHGLVETCRIGAADGATKVGLLWV